MTFQFPPPFFSICLNNPLHNDHGLPKQGAGEQLTPPLLLKTNKLWSNSEVWFCLPPPLLCNFQRPCNVLVWFGCVDAFQRMESGYPLRDFASRPRGVEPPSTRQLELQPAWDKGGILRPFQS